MFKDVRRILWDITPAPAGEAKPQPVVKIFLINQKRCKKEACRSIYVEILVRFFLFFCVIVGITTFYIYKKIKTFCKITLNLLQFLLFFGNRVAIWYKFSATISLYNDSSDTSFRFTHHYEVVLFKQIMMSDTVYPFITEKLQRREPMWT